MFPVVAHLNGCNGCHCPTQRDAMTVDAKTEGLRYHFRGRCDISVHEMVSNYNAMAIDDVLSTQILFRIPPILVMFLPFCLQTLTFKPAHHI